MPYSVNNSAAFDLLFYTSVSANACVLLYPLLFWVAHQIVVCCCKTMSTPGVAAKLRDGHKNKRQFMHNVYMDSFVHTVMMSTTTVLILTTHAMNTPFETNSSYDLQVLYSCITGVYIFLFFKEVILSPDGPRKWMNFIIYGVSIATLATVVITKEDVAIVTIIIISNGDTLNVNAARVMKNVLLLHGSASYRIALFMGTYATVVFRALLPIGLTVLALLNGKPFNMSYPSVFFFYVGLLFFGALNTWQVNVALSRICRKGSRMQEVHIREVAALPKPEDQDIIAGIELPPTYDEVCGTSSDTNITIPEPEANATNVKTNQSGSEVVPVLFNRTASVESGLGCSATDLNVIPNISSDDFTEIDLGIPSTE